MGKKNMYAITNWAHTNKFDNHLHISIFYFIFCFWGLFWHFLAYLLALLLVPTLAKFTPEKCKNMKCFMKFTKAKNELINKHLMRKPQNVRDM